MKPREKSKTHYHTSNLESTECWSNVCINSNKGEDMQEKVKAARCCHLVAAFKCMNWAFFYPCYEEVKADLIPLRN